jgi:alanyl-tRNA synthetase
LLKDKASNLKGDLVKEAEHINGINFIGKQLELEQNAVKDLVFDIGKDQTNLFVIIGTVTQGKPMLTCFISKDLVASRDLNAGQVVRELGKLIQGGGGGQAFYATAGGKKPDGISEAIEKAREMLRT